MSVETETDKPLSSLGGSDFIQRYMTHYKSGNIWTIETGCLLFSSWMVYYLMFITTDSIGILDRIVTLFFFLGALTFLTTFALFNRISRSYASNDFVRYLKIGNKYLFAVLSFLPGLYYAFKYEHFILKFYLIAYFVSSAHFLYKRYRDFEFKPFVIGLGMSAVLFCSGPFIRGFFSLFGSGSFASGCASFVETLLDLALAVAFLFGLKFVKFFMYFLSWQTWFILMVFATWRNVGSGARALFEVGKTKPFGLEEEKIDDTGRETDDANIVKLFN